MENINNSIFLLAGRSKSNPDPVMQIVFRIFGVENPEVAYIGAASGDNLEFFNYMTAAFRSSGAGNVFMVPTITPDFDIDKTREILEQADIIFISGGDVEFGMSVLNSKELVGVLADLYRKGKKFFGISAGSIMLAQKWIRWTDPNDDQTAEIFPCCGLAPLICDTHGETDQWEELKALLMLETKGSIGYGITSGSAIQIDGHGEIQAYGGNIARFIRREDKIELLTDLLPSLPVDKNIKNR